MNETNGGPNAERTKKEGQQRQFLSCRSCVCFQVFCLNGLDCEESKFDHERGFSRRHVIDVNTGEGPREHLLFPVTFMPCSCFAFPCLIYYFLCNKERTKTFIGYVSWPPGVCMFLLLHTTQFTQTLHQYKTLTTRLPSVHPKR